MEPNFKSADYNSGWKRVKKVSDENKETDINIKISSLKDEVDRIKEKIEAYQKTEEDKTNEIKANVLNLKLNIDSILKMQSEVEKKINLTEQRLNEIFEGKKAIENEKQSSKIEEIEKKILFMQNQYESTIETKKEIEEIKRSFEEYKNMVNNQLFLISEILQGIKDGSIRQQDKNAGLFASLFKKTQ
ncbi:hypothetical protein [Caloramator quimbayensis]|nr:hypothetical protein [Caloramator quimbayensis]